MLPPDSREILLDLLRPPIGYRLDAAVATTFTLQLSAALLPPIAFASFEIRETPDPVAALEAVRSCADRLDIFCQAGQIGVPPQASDLMAFLEPMVHEVTAARPGHLFHPKVWFLRYSASDLPDQYRLLCGTRNLAEGRSWDAVVRMDGARGRAVVAGNRPLSAFIAHLPDRCVTPLPEERLEQIMALAEDARRIEWDFPDDVNEVAFHALGVPGERPGLDFSGYRHLVVAPFCNDRGLEHLVPTPSSVTLVSRLEGLEQLTENTLAGLDDSFILDPLAGLEDPEADAVTPSVGVEQLGGLHAKLVVVERNRQARVFLGSANATYEAYNGNVEFLVEMIGGASRLGVDTFLSADGGFGALLQEYRATGGVQPTAQDEARHELEKLLRSLAARRYLLDVSPADDQDGWTLMLTSTAPSPDFDGFRVTAELLTAPGDARELAPGSVVATRYLHVALADITPFVVLQATGPTGLRLGTVVRADLRGDPPDRLDQVLARQVDTPEKFLRFLVLLLGIGDPGAVLAADASGSGAGPTEWQAASFGILELIMRALADQPDALLDLDRLVERLRTTEQGRAVLPAGFTELWNTTTTARSRLEHA